MKTRDLYCFFLILILSLLFSRSIAGNENDRAQQVKDSVKHQKRTEKREELKKSHSRYNFMLGFVFARLNTEISFELPDGILSASLGLEDDLGLPGQKTFLTGAFIYRATPRSGVYAHYYGISRTEQYETQNDLIFLDDTIPAGLSTTNYFNTRVFSAGYLFSVLEDPNAYLGAYLNVYFMMLNTGIRSDIGNIDKSVDLLAPLPNFGLIAMFRLTNWMQLDANVGFFSLHTTTFKGTIYDFNVSLLFKPTRWLGLSICYQEFDINARFPSDNITTTVDYNFRGPALGVKVTF